tara:strand:- start:10 stop:315 length:306 start_codon:yes stop_codon:yes gene_type:complete
MIFQKLHKALLLGVLFVSVSSCSLPPFVSTINHIKTGVDGLLMLSGEKTTNDRVLSDVTEMDCRMDRLLMAKDICKEIMQPKSKQSLDSNDEVIWEYHHNP